MAHEYVDEAESGGNDERPQFRQMIDAGRRNNAPLPSDSCLEIQPFHPQKGARRDVQVHASSAGNSASSPFTEHADDSPTGKLMEAIIETMDEFLLGKIWPKRLCGARERQPLADFWVTPHAPYGYKRVHVDDGPQEAAQARS